MTDDAYQLEIAGLTKCENDCTEVVTDPRPWVGIHFKCCGVYVRVYRDPTASAYRSACPHCGKPVSLRVGSEGVNARFFTAE